MLALYNQTESRLGVGVVGLFLFRACFLFRQKILKTTCGSKRPEEHMRVGLNSTVLLEALGERFVWFGENNARLRRIQARLVEGPGRGYGERLFH